MRPENSTERRRNLWRKLDLMNCSTAVPKRQALAREVHAFESLLLEYLPAL